MLHFLSNDLPQTLRIKVLSAFGVSAITNEELVSGDATFNFILETALNEQR